MAVAIWSLNLPRWLFGVALSYVLWRAARVLQIAFDKDLRKIPGPRLAAFTNLPLKLQVLTGNRTTYIHSLHQAYGPFVRISPREVAIADSEAARWIHRVGSDFEKGPWYQGQTPYQYDDDTCGVFGLRDVRKATARRKLFLRAGTRKMVQGWEPAIAELARLTVDKIKQDLLQQGRSDSMKWWSLMAADVSGLLAFGESWNCVNTGEKSIMIRDIEDAMVVVGLYLEARWIYHLSRLLPIPTLQKRCGIFRRFLGYGAQAARNTKDTAKTRTRTLFSDMVADGEELQQLPDSLIESEASNVIVAGTDTTAMTLTYLVYLVLKHEQVKEKLITEVVECNENASYERLEQLPYLNAVVLETFRLYPAVPASLTRVVPASGWSFGEYTLPAGTIVGTQAYTMHRDHNVWQDPERFDPERWLNAPSSMRDRLMVFGGSARICLGQNIARTEILHTVFRLFRTCPNIKLAATTNERSMAMMDYFVIKPKGEKCEIELQ